ncbi:ATPase AAA domain-containing protein 2B [Podila humilis]|nr:ATPase AAA domain-containing protein 2B [Podila humilis]
MDHDPGRTTNPQQYFDPASTPSVSNDLKRTISSDNESHSPLATTLSSDVAQHDLCSDYDLNEAKRRRIQDDRNKHSGGEHNHNTQKNNVNNTDSQSNGSTLNGDSLASLSSNRYTRNSRFSSPSHINGPENENCNDTASIDDQGRSGYHGDISVEQQKFGLRRPIKHVNYEEPEDLYTEEDEDEERLDKDERNDDEDAEDHRLPRISSQGIHTPPHLAKDNNEGPSDRTGTFGRILRDRRSIASPKPFAPVINKLHANRLLAQNNESSRQYEESHHSTYHLNRCSVPPKQTPPPPRPVNANMRITRGMSGSLMPDAPMSRISRDMTPDRPTRRNGPSSSRSGNRLSSEEYAGLVDQHHAQNRHDEEDDDEDFDGVTLSKEHDKLAVNMTSRSVNVESGRRLTRLRARVQAQPQTNVRHTASPSSRQVRSSRTGNTTANLPQQEADRKYDLRERPKNRPTYIADQPIALPSRSRTSRMNMFGGRDHYSRSKSNRPSLLETFAHAGASSSDELGAPNYKRHSSKGESRSSSSRIMPMNFGELANSRKDVIAMRGGQPADTDPLAVGNSVDFGKVGGLDHHIKSLKEMVILPLLYPEVYSHFQMMPPRGVLFHGPPGTGKTLLARALASSCSTETQKVAFFMRKGADCLSKWVGEAERQLRLLFEEARAWQPSIIFFDEIDGLCPVRSSKQEQIHASIVSTMLALMDGLDERGQVIVIGATNRIDAIDPALRRPGRFDREFYFPLPNEAARRSIIDINTCGWTPPLDEKFKDELAKLTTRYCGADIKALCTEAALKAIRRRYPQIYESNEKLLIDASSIVVEEIDMLKSAKSLTPASYRVTGATATPLPDNIKPLLQPQLEHICTTIETVFTGTNKRSSKGKDAEDEDASFQAMGYRSFEKLKTFRPRMIISGSRGMGQRYIGPALLHYLEGCTIQQFDLAALMTESSRTPEAACVQFFIEVKRHAPSVIYIPHIDVWWTVVSDAVKATFSNLLEDLNPEDGILFLATSDTPLNRLPVTILRWFLSSVKGQIELTKPTAEHRELFFKSILHDLGHPPSEFKMEVTPPKALEPLRKAPPPAPRVLTVEEKRLLQEHDQYILRELRISLRSIVDELFKERKFKPFFRPVEAEENVDYYDIVKNPMDLTTINDKINNHLYLEVNEFLEDIDLIVENATLYNDIQDPNRIVYRAQGFQDWVHSMAGRLDPELLIETKKTAARVRQEPKSQKKTGPTVAGARASSSSSLAASTSGVATGLSAPQGERISRRRLGLEAPAVMANPELILRNRMALAKLGLDPTSREVSMDPIKEEVSSPSVRHKGQITRQGSEDTARVRVDGFAASGPDDEADTLTSVITESSMSLGPESVDGNMDVDTPKQASEVRFDSEAQTPAATTDAEKNAAAFTMQMESEIGTGGNVEAPVSGMAETKAIVTGEGSSSMDHTSSLSTITGTSIANGTAEHDQQGTDIGNWVHGVSMTQDESEHCMVDSIEELGPLDTVEESATRVTDMTVSMQTEKKEEEKVSMEGAEKETQEFVLDLNRVASLGASLVLDTEECTVEELDQLKAALYSDIWEHRHEWNKDALLKDMVQTLQSIVKLHQEYRESEGRAAAAFLEAFQ